MTAAVETISTSSVKYIKELYPRLKPLDEVVEQYRHAIENLPPIVVAKNGVLVDGYHRWQAHVREGIEQIRAENLGDLSDAEIVRESIRRNATHGQQLSSADKKRMAGKLWGALADLQAAERVKDIADLLAVSERSIQAWTKDARKKEKEEQQDKAWDAWLDCREQATIGDELGVHQTTVGEWLKEKRSSADFLAAPDARQHFDVWQFPTTDRESGQQSYFGAIPPQVVENLLWFYTEPGQVVVDPFAGSGTTVDVAKRMGRRVWASDRLGNKYSPHLPIHQHNIADGGWPDGAPAKADLILLDPPYWAQAKGRYSQDIDDMGNCDLEVFYAAWWSVVKTCMGHAKRIAYIISPTQQEDGSVIDHATDMLRPFITEGWTVERRIIVPYSTQQATGQQVTWARENKRMLKLYRDLVVLSA